MRPTPLRAAAVGLAFVAASAAGAAQHTVQVLSSNVFSPASLTIQAGDTVTWTNVGGGFHNVQADDGSFRCAQGCDGQGGNGEPSSAAWSFSRTFPAAGSVPYHCQVHVGLGMRGTILVQAAPDPEEPGSLRFAVGNLSADEDAGTVTVQVTRVGGDDGAVSVGYATSDGSAQGGVDYTPASGTLTWPDGDDDARSFTVAILDDDDDESDETVNLTLSSPTGGAALGSPSSATLTLRDDDDSAPTPGRIGFVSPLYTTSEGDGAATVQVARKGGRDGAVSVAYAVSDGSGVAGSDYTPASGTLSWGDGVDGVRSFTVGVLDDGDEEPTETVNLALSSPTGGAVLDTSSATLEIVDDDVPSGCVRDETTMCLNLGDRFRARLTWEKEDGETGVGRVVVLENRDSGLFYFFGANNIEMLLKVLNGCNITGHYWVFYAATTNVGFELVVADTAHGVAKTYPNPVGVPAQPVLDTAAFATCP